MVALIGGAHSLGGAREANSGFSGQWTRALPDQADVFSKAFFVKLVVGWQQVPCNDTRVDAASRCKSHSSLQ